MAGKTVSGVYYSIMTGFVFFSCASEKENAKDIRPNLLFIFTDQQTLNAMGAYGNPYLRTPNMDDLARFGVRFTQSYCTSPVSSPSRSSLMTSRMPHETEVNYNEHSINSSIPNMGHIFQEAGYQTWYAGKWHLPENYPAIMGLDSIPGFRVLSISNPSRVTGLGEDTDPLVTDKVVEFIKSKPQGPFLLAVSLHNPHDICKVPSNIRNIDSLVNINAAPLLPQNHFADPNEPEFIKDCRIRKHYGHEVSLTKNFSTQDWRQYLYHYYRYTERVDQEIGRILEALEFANLEENTVIVFTSDHGDGAAAHQWAVKLSLYEESVKVPMIVTWFGKTPAGLVDSINLVSGLDVLPTLMDYAGIIINQHLSGKSLKAIIDGKASGHDFIVSELAPDPQYPERMGRMVRTKRFKYNVFSYGKNNEQLFDILNDPNELNNLSQQPSMSAVLEEHRLKLDNWIINTSDYFVRPVN